VRLIHLTVPEAERRNLISILKDRNLGYTVTNDTAEESDNRIIVSFITPADAVEHILADIREAGIDTETYTVSIETEFARFKGIDEVQDNWDKTPNKIAPTTLRSKAKDMRPNSRSYLWMMLLSTVIATAGLFLSSPAIVVGSMVLAPIVSPMLTASVGTVRNDRGVVLESLQMQGLGIGLSVVGAFLFSLLVRYFFGVPGILDVPMMELISIRSSPGLLSVVVGLAAGAGGAFGLATKGNVTIVGVMVAAALIPTAAAAGIGFAWGELALGIGSLILLLITIIAVNLGSTLMFVYLGYRPDDVDEGLFNFSSVRQTAVVLATVGVVVGLVFGVGFLSYQQVSFQQSVNSAVTDVLDQPAYEELEITEINSGFIPADSFSDTTTVTITLSRSADQEYESLPNDLDRAISDRTGEDIRVQVQYQGLHQSSVE